MIKKYAIEKGIPFRARRSGLADQFLEMVVGDWLVIPSDDASVDVVRSTSHRCGKKHAPMKWRVCKTEGGVRVWRIE